MEEHFQEVLTKSVGHPLMMSGIIVFTCNQEYDWISFSDDPRSREREIFFFF